MPMGNVGEAPRTRSGRRDGLSFWADRKALDGSNPTSFQTPFRTIKYAVACLNNSAATGDATHTVSAVINGTAVDVYAWMPTSGTDPTLVASTGTENVTVFVVGVY